MKFVDYDEKYISFISGSSFYKGSNTIFQDYWDWDALSEKEVQESLSYAEFRGFLNIGSTDDKESINIIISENNDDLINTVKSVMIEFEKIGIKIELNNKEKQISDMKYVITIENSYEEGSVGGIASMTLSTEFNEEGRPKEWGPSLITLNNVNYNELENLKSILLHEILHAIGHGHDGKYNGVSWLDNINPFAFPEEGSGGYRAAVCNTTYIDNFIPAENILAANLELLWMHTEDIPQNINNDSNTYDFSNKMVFSNIVDTGGVDNLILGDAFRPDTTYTQVQKDSYQGHEINLQIGGISYIRWYLGEHVGIFTSTITMMKPVEVGSGDDITSFSGSLIENVTSGDGNDTIHGNHVDNIVKAGKGNDSVYGYDGNDLLYGQAGDDKLWGQAGSDTFYGEAGNDVMHGGNDTLGGMDSLSYHTVQNTFQAFNHDENGQFFAHHFGIIVDHEQVQMFMNGEKYIDLFYEMEKLTGTRFNDSIKHAEVSEVRAGDGHDLLVFDATSNTLHLYGDNGNDTIIGGQANDHLYGGGHNDRLEGNGGNDHLYGGAGNDVLIGGNGNDHLDGGNDFDTASYEHATQGVTVDLRSGKATVDGGSENGIDTLISIEAIIGSDYADTLIIEQSDSKAYGGEGNDSLYAYGFRNTLHGDGGNDVLYSRGRIGSFVVMHGGDGDDTLITTTVNNVSGDLYGGDGNDRIYAQRGQFDIYGGTGNDYIHAGTYTARHHTYAYGGEGRDLFFVEDAAVVSDFNPEEDIIVFNKTGLDGDHWIAGYEHPFHLVQSGKDVLVKWGMDYSYMVIRIKDVLTSDFQLNGNGKNYAVAYENEAKTLYENLIKPTDSDKTLIGNQYSSILNGGSGNDYISGLSGTDEIYGNDGNDTILGGTDSDFLYGGIGNDNLDGEEGNDEIHGQSGNDQIFGGLGSDTLDGGRGNDLLTGGSDSNTYLFSRNFGNDTITDFKAGDVINVATTASLVYAGFTHSGDDTLLRFTGIGNPTILVKNMRLTAEDISISAGKLIVAKSQTLNGDDTNNILIGAEGVDRINGHNGNDTIDGAMGNDILNGGDGGDTFLFTIERDHNDIVQGFGHDTILDFANVNNYNHNEKIVIQTYGLNEFPTFTLTFNGKDSLLTFADGSATGSSIRILNYHLHEDEIYNNHGKITLYANPTQRVLDDIKIGTDSSEYLEGWAGNDSLEGAGGNDTLYGGTGDDILDGGEGNDDLWGENGDDQLTGGEGHDTFGFIIQRDYQDVVQGFGSDTITDFGATVDNGYAEQILIVAYNLETFPDFTVTLDGADSILTFFDDSDTGSSLRLLNYHLYEYEIYVSYNTITLYSNPSQRIINDVIIGTNYADYLEGWGGNDYLDGSKGNDGLSGGMGDDTLIGGEGDDELWGESGDDQLTGGNNNDVFHFIIQKDYKGVIEGFGHDTILDFGDIDTHSYKEKIVIQTYNLDMFPEFVLTFDGKDSLLTFLDGSPTGSSIKLLNYQLFEHEIYVSYGSITLYADPSHRVIHDVKIGTNDSDILEGWAGNDFLDGVGGNDGLYGGAGNDTILGGEGDDDLWGENGDDQLTGGNGHDTFTFIIDTDYNGHVQGFGHDIISDFGFGPVGEDPYPEQIIIGAYGIDEFPDFTLNIDGNDSVLTFNDGSPAGSSIRLLNYHLSEYDMYVSYGSITLHANHAQRVIDDVIIGTNESDYLDGGAGNDSLDGGEGDDVLAGGTGDDTLLGGDGDDELWGDDGHDVLNAGSGNNILLGGAGNDRFLFNDEENVTKILDFEDNMDKIVFKDVGVRDISDLVITSRGQLGSTVSYNGGTIHLDGFNADNLSANDFLFV